MANSAGDPNPSSRQEIFHTYLSSCGSEGAGGACEDLQVRTAARELLLRQTAEDRFSLLPFYPIVDQCLQHGAPSALCQENISLLMKATELLEKLCVNLFLFPWKKEIRSLKKFTGSFVYYIEPGLPNQAIKTILQIIGYGLETDAEYVLVDGADPDVAKRMGFELFLARLECENLLEAMGQTSHAECLEIVQRRAASQTILGISGSITEEEHQRDYRLARTEALEEDKPLVSGPESNPGTNEEQGRVQSLKLSNPELQKIQQFQESTVSEEERSSSSILSEDQSILEMKENYPDLAIRQKLIFKKTQKSVSPPKIKDWIGSRETPSAHLHPVNTDLSGPQSIALHTESATSRRNLQIPEQLEPTEPRTSEEKLSFVLRVGNVLQKPGFSPEALSDDGLVAELAERMGKLQMKEFSADEPLKYPIEETAQAQPGQGCRDFMPVSPPRSPEDKNPPVLCRPSQQPTCTISGCGSCVGSAVEPERNDPIKEPPHSFYIPNSLSGCSVPLAAPTGLEPNCSEGSGLQLHRSAAQQPEDDLVQTFVVL